MPDDGWIDVSVAILDGLVHWPDDPPVRIEHISSLDRGDEATVSRLDMSAHTGTHIDSPAHYLPGGAGIEDVSLSATVGTARVIEIPNQPSISSEHLRQHQPATGERLLLKTRNSTMELWARGEFYEDFAHLSPEGAGFLGRCGIRTIGVDYLSVAGFKEGGKETHIALLESGICIIEGLDLSRVTPGGYELLCLPLKIIGCDGAPARALLRPLSEGAES